MSPGTETDSRAMGQFHVLPGEAIDLISPGVAARASWQVCRTLSQREQPRACLCVLIFLPLTFWGYMSSVATARSFKQETAPWFGVTLKEVLSHFRKACLQDISPNPLS